MNNQVARFKRSLRQQRQLIRELSRVIAQLRREAAESQLREDELFREAGQLRQRVRAHAQTIRLQHELLVRYLPREDARVLNQDLGLPADASSSEADSGIESSAPT